MRILAIAAMAIVGCSGAIAEPVSGFDACLEAAGCQREPEQVQTCATEAAGGLASEIYADGGLQIWCCPSREVAPNQCPYPTQTQFGWE